MNKRLNEIFSAIPSCNVFADIGCDHGYIAYNILHSGKCKKVIISDISKKCLQKAENLLKEDIASGNAISVVSNGFEFLPPVDCALIAGMGGEEICQIISSCKSLPEKLILQPMKNASEVRKFAVKSGYKIVKDYLFYAGKIYYDLICLEKGEDFLTEEETEYGRDNVKNPSADFIRYVHSRIKIIDTCTANIKIGKEAKNVLLCEKERLKKYV